MIVRSTGHSLLLITQPDHAHLAARVMDRCVPLRSHPRRQEILHAIAEHDNGWREEDAAPSVNPETGAIQDFINASLDVRHRVWPRAVARLADSPWAAALVAQHAITVYDRFRADLAWEAFFRSMEEARDAMLRAADRPLEELLPDYVYVRLGDLISLTFCNDWAEEQRYGEFRVRPDGPHLAVVPDIFGGASVSFEIEAREIPQQSYRSEAVLHSAVRRASTVVLRGEVSGAPAAA